ncbi:MAG: hypothetical protein V9F01_03615 [Chitinophagaceae bacterium]
MKFTFAAACFLLVLASCNSSKSKDDAKPEIKDTAVNVADSLSGHSPKDSAAGEADLGGAGDITLGLSAAKITELLGQPESKSKAIEWGADGLMHQDWMYKSKGIALNMSSDKADAGQTVFSITISSPCTLKTKMNMGIGSSYKEVMAAYEKSIDREATDNKTITVGSVYGGIIFTFSKEGKADTVFIGAAAE